MSDCFICFADANNGCAHCGKAFCDEHFCDCEPGAPMTNPNESPQARLQAMVRKAQYANPAAPWIEILRFDALDLLAQLDAAKAKVSDLQSDRSKYDCRFAGPYFEISGIHCPSDDPCLRCQLDAANARAEAMEKALAYSRKRDTMLDDLCNAVDERKAALRRAEAAEEHRAMLVEALEDRINGSCQWTQDEHHDSWDGTCGVKFILIEGTPEENKMKFCPECGRTLIHRAYLKAKEEV